MKKILFILSLCLVFGCKSKKTAVAALPPEPKVTKVTVSEIAPDIKDKAYDLGRRVLMTCNVSKFRPFNTTEATPSVIKNMTKERLTKTCLKFRLKYGDFRDLELMEIYKNTTDKSTVFRYKAHYEKKIANKELRLTLNEKNQVSSIKSLDWTDDYLKEKKPAKQPKTI